MKYTNIKFYFIENVLINVNTAGYNRYQSIIKLAAMNYLTCVLKPKFCKKYQNKIIRGFIYRLEAFMLLIRYIHKFHNKELIFIYLFGINPIFLAILYIVKKIYTGVYIINEVNEYPKSVITNNKYKIWLNDKFLYPCLLDIVDIYTLISDQLIEYFKKYCKKSFLCKLPMTVDFSRFEANTQNDLGNYIFYAGSINQKKDGIHYLIQAYSNIHKELNNINLVICGFGSDSDLLAFNNLLQVNQIEEKVKFLGHVSRDEIPSLIKNAKLCVLPRPNTIQAQGGFPSKLGEYLASGNPVIVTDVGEIPLYLSKEEVYFISHKNIQYELGKTIIEVLSNYEYALNTANNGKIKAYEEFGLKRNSDRIKDIINYFLQHEKKK